MSKKQNEEWQGKPDKNDGNGIVENTFTEHKSIEINVNMEIIKDGKYRH